ncbi:division/cell wall cluster transcriptional repressor MraZ [Patescibacteria group bacterium]|nr:division/cell wall cluster transcriptional repressor MraZ [Patescibacteria group bacterium]
MFIGEYAHNLDDKGRLAIPAKFRMLLDNGAVITRSLDNKCLTLYPRKKWEEIAEKLANIPIGQSSARAFARIILSGATDVEFDKQGRVNLPTYLLKFAKFEKKAIVTGQYDKIEIWSDDAWNEYAESAEISSDKVAEGLAALGL